MKTSTDPRHIHREHLMNKLFSYSFHSRQIDPDIKEVIRHLPAIDEKIRVAAPEWPVDKIAKIDLAILRLALYELWVTKKEPPKVVIDEAIELAKAFGNEHSSQFVNGVLGTVLKNL